MRTSGTRPGFRPLAALAALAMIAGACGGSAATPSAAASAAASTAPTTAPTPAQSNAASAPASEAASASANPAAVCGGYSGPPAKITVAVWGDATELANQQRIVDAVMAKDPSITIKVTVSDWDNYWPKLQTDLGGGNAPDVFAMDGPLFPDYQSRDQMLNLTPLIARDGFDVGQLASLAVKDFQTADGQQYGLPRDLNTIALFYNKAMFDAAGIAYPDASWDWAKLADVAKQLTKTSGGVTSQWGFYTETSDMENYWSSLVWQAGGEILNPDKTQVAIDTDQAAQGIQFLQDLIYKDKVMAQPVPGGAGDMFENGQAAMEANGSWLVATHEAAGINFGVAPLPKGPAGQATSLNPTGLVVYKGTHAADAAWEFLKCVASPEMQAMAGALKSSMPVNLEVLNNQYATSFDGGKTFADAIGYAHLKPSFRGYDEFNTLLQGELDNNVFNEAKKTAKQALDDIAPKLQQLIAQ
ncbi:MAG: sugar ABC transporter substrate-binding protein [Chloroflexota bacterium]